MGDLRGKFGEFSKLHSDRLPLFPSGFAARQPSLVRFPRSAPKPRERHKIGETDSTGDRFPETREPMALLSVLASAVWGYLARLFSQPSFGNHREKRERPELASKR